MASLSLLTADDLFLFNQGTHYRLYDKLGAHVVDGGTYFAVWAPNARAVSVIGDWNGWRAGADPLRAARVAPGSGRASIPGVGHGARYKFAIVGARRRARATRPIRSRRAPSIRRRPRRSSGSRSTRGTTPRG